MLTKFQDRVFLKEDRWYIWDTSLGLFRPIDNFAWNGTAWVVDDIAYRRDPMEKTYCFGSPEMLANCVALSKKYESKIDNVPTASYLGLGTPVWFRDRPVNFTHSASRDMASWKRVVKGHARTCKRRSTNKFTKRTL
jgi:hypothetical protein